MYSALRKTLREGRGKRQSARSTEFERFRCDGKHKPTIRSQIGLWGPLCVQKHQQPLAKALIFLKAYGTNARGKNAEDKERRISRTPCYDECSLRLRHRVHASSDFETRHVDTVNANHSVECAQIQSECETNSLKRQISNRAL